MPCVHNFGIIENLEDFNEDEFEPEKYNCIFIEDDFLGEIYHAGFKEKLDKLETYFHNLNRPNTSLAFYGTTLIPQTSLEYFLSITINENIKHNSKELEMLIEKISTAIKENKWMIHYGI
ncbi:hypothetical protein Curi_c17480 [Gottschalkia acidurici 9a]|uniref:Uncharacterized protein n=1 Tax=Gottschalkia acidurici (strain ATCC 7906 / DSM 604 / BCRC 14475 / CIP 104303 / KCTC 5404 / NCIMB 10678 / 9a) TaxID=1128398 RepID=K0B1B4_GOTA9|nr:hypothetical protein [Gottschalkia acidurici]AFS78755.1 hypothetical protein Curi_c17480 [Gottschalkia acidurici 9a]